MIRLVKIIPKITAGCQTINKDDDILLREHTILSVASNP